MTRPRIRHGFSLIEVIVASIILSSAVVAICSISTRSFLGVKLNRDYEHAWDLLDRQLTMIDQMGVDAFLEMGVTSGICDADTTGVPHYWQAAALAHQIPGLYTVAIAVSWQDGPRLRQVTATTLLNAAPIVEEEETQPQVEDQGGTPQGGGPQGGGQGASASGGGRGGQQGAGSSGGGARGGSSGRGGSGGGGSSRGGSGGGSSRGGASGSGSRSTGGRR
jgi:prepilin-type N-terminal cleavage/methylation domain-containing protein